MNKFLRRILIIGFIVVFAALMFYVYWMGMHEGHNPLTQPVPKENVFNGILNIFESNLGLK